ncbi:MAG: DUF1934 domain-containing protein [Clostridia bacterium]|nr:DUF1934 domain-containing protein [Clostridia bacterium]
MKKEKKAMINIKSAHFTPNENYIKNMSIIDAFAPANFDAVDAQRIDIDYEGVLFVNDGRLTVKYDESELTGMVGAVTEISFALDEPGIVMMNRSGAVRGSLCFEMGSRIDCVQDTGDMILSFVVDTEALQNELSEDGGELKIAYCMEFRGSPVQRSLMHITVSAS